MGDNVQTQVNVIMEMQITELALWGFMYMAKSHTAEDGHESAIPQQWRRLEDTVCSAVELLGVQND